MTVLLDLVAVAAVVAALAFLLRPRRLGRCGGCAPRDRGIEARVSIAEMRERVRRASRRA